VTSALENLVIRQGRERTPPHQEVLRGNQAVFSKNRLETRKNRLENPKDLRPRPLLHAVFGRVLLYRPPNRAIRRRNHAVLRGGNAVLLPNRQVWRSVDWVFWILQAVFSKNRLEKSKNLTAP